MRIGVLLTARSVRGSGERLRSAGVGGITLTSEPVSIRNLVFVCASLTKNRRLEVGPVALVAANVWPTLFPRCRAPGISWQLHQTFCGTNRGSRQCESVGAGLCGRRPLERLRPRCGWWCVMEATRSVRCATSALSSCSSEAEVEVAATVGGATTSTILSAISASLARSVLSCSVRRG